MTGVRVRSRQIEQCGLACRDRLEADQVYARCHTRRRIRGEIEAGRVIGPTIAGRDLIDRSFRRDRDVAVSAVVAVRPFVVPVGVPDSVRRDGSRVRVDVAVRDDTKAQSGRQQAGRDAQDGEGFQRRSHQDRPQGRARTELGLITADYRACGAFTRGYSPAAPASFRPIIEIIVGAIT